jgi:hypothetical protein
LFSTPYVPGQIAVETAMPASIRLDRRGETLFRAQMAGGRFHAHTDVGMAPMTPCHAAADAHADVGMAHQGECRGQETTVLHGTTAEHGEDLAIFLPSKGAGRGTGLVFCARLSGPMRTFPFMPDDVIEIRRSSENPVLGWLVDSLFTGVEWGIRQQGTHARSKTFEW